MYIKTMPKKGEKKINKQHDVHVILEHEDYYDLMNKLRRRGLSFGQWVRMQIKKELRR